MQHAVRTELSLYSVGAGELAHKRIQRHNMQCAMRSAMRSTLQGDTEYYMHNTECIHTFLVSLPVFFTHTRYRCTVACWAVSGFSTNNI